MAPITLACEETLSVSSERIAEQILDLARWRDFTGFAVLPGIKSAQFEVRTPRVVGSRIRVTNTDGSSHVEEIVEWLPDSRLTLHLNGFSAPLSRWATRFEETWEFERRAEATRVRRSFRLYAKSPLGWPPL